MTKIYIAGPMQGKPDYNRTAFMEADEGLKALGYKTFNPAATPLSEMVHDGKLTKQEAYRNCMYEDLKFITQEADEIYMLHGWEYSVGARAEHATAVSLGLLIKYQSGF